MPFYYVEDVYISKEPAGNMISGKGSVASIITELGGLSPPGRDLGGRAP